MPLPKSKACEFAASDCKAGRCGCSRAQEPLVESLPGAQSSMRIDVARSGMLDDEGA